MSYRVKFLDYSRLYTHYQPVVDDAMKQALVTGHLILQRDVEEFEQRFAEYLGVKHVVSTNSGTDALMLALIAAGVGPGDEVITVSNTFIATIQVIHHLGAKPVLVDVGEDGLIDMDLMTDALDLDKTKAVMPVHLAGDYVPEFYAAAPIIEDACQAVGAKGVGYGYAQCYSFYPAKVLGTFGDGGALATNSDEVALRVKSLRNHGGVQKYDQATYEYGWNSRMDNVWAAVLNVKLDSLDVDLAKRKAIAEYYSAEFKELPIKLPTNREGRVWQDYVVETSDRDNLYFYLKEHGVETLGKGLVANHRHPGLGLEGWYLPNTDRIIAQSLRLPCNHFMKADEIEYVAATVKDFF